MRKFILIFSLLTFSYPVIACEGFDHAMNALEASMAKKGIAIPPQAKPDPTAKSQSSSPPPASRKSLAQPDEDLVEPFPVEAPPQSLHAY
jgi:hypothetical protein